jgi:hypothetical protein
MEKTEKLEINFFRVFLNLNSSSASCKFHFSNEILCKFKRVFHSIQNIYPALQNIEKKNL